MLTLPVLILVSLAPQASNPVPAMPSEVTFVDVAPIVHARCTACHRPNAAGPFPLRTYREVAKRGPMIAAVVEEGLMPPWHPVEGHGTFRDALAITEAERQTLVQWIDSGMAEGDPAAAPAPPEFPGGWQLGTPDLVVSMSAAFEVPATGADLYRNFSVPVPLENDRWLTAIEVRPGAPRVLHHIVFDVDTRQRGRRYDGKDGKPGWDAMTGQGGGAVGWDDGGPLLGTSLGGWAVGQVPRHLPEGLARRFPKGADLILRSHFHPSGKAETEQTQIGLYFSDERPAKKLLGLQMPPMFGTAAGIDIPAGESEFRIRDSFTLPVDARALTVGGHAHSILREMKVEVTPPNGEAQSVFWIDDWDFDWQNRYEWQSPIEMVAGTEIAVTLVWDNSSQNPDNPYDPPRRVRWGFQSTDEMGSVTLGLVAKNDAEANTLWRAMEDYKDERMSKASRASRRNEGMQAWRMSMGDRVRTLDVDGNGELSKDELGGAAQRLVQAADKNGDGALDREELVAVLGDSVLPNPAFAARTQRLAADLDGVQYDVLHPGEYGLVRGDAVRAHVLFFTTVDCPIANGYSPEIAAIARAYAGDGVRSFMVHVDPDVTADAARSHAAEYGIAMPVLLDGEHRLVRSLGIRRTPEVCVIARGGDVVYQGRIDDQYRALGRRRPAPTTRDLRTALEALLAGEAIEDPRTDPIGCELPVLLDQKDR